MALGSTQSTSAPPRVRTRPLSRDRGGDARSAALAESMVAHQRAISVHQGAMVGEIAEFARTEAFRGDGALSMAAWLSDRCRLSAASARTLTESHVLDAGAALGDWLRTRAQESAVGSPGS